MQDAPSIPVIISDRHRYLFVELPRTGSTAVHRELKARYDGTPILTKHATYRDFLKIATEDQKRYFVFSSVRNPLDDAVSKYFKVKGGRAHGAVPRGRAGNRPPGKRRGRDRLINRLLDTHMTRFVRRTDADFPTFFLRYSVLPYDTWASLDHQRFGLVMHFETLTDDFERALRRIGLEPQRPLPVANPTAGRQPDYASYYVPQIRGRARRVLGPYMERWGYQFPASWGIRGPTRVDWLGYRVYSFFACLYWRYLRSGT